MGLAFWLSDKTIRKFAELRIYCQRNKNVAQRLSGDKVLWGYSFGLPEEDASNQWTVFTLTVLTHAVHFTDACRK